jgi:hypothetical protein
MPPRAKRPREDGGGARSSKVARGSEKPSSRSSKAAPTVPPALGERGVLYGGSGGGAVPARSVFVPQPV